MSNNSFLTSMHNYNLHFILHSDPHTFGMKGRAEYIGRYQYGLVIYYIFRSFTMLIYQY